jgi:L-threonylcarbamoyladenylate synthase
VLTELVRVDPDNPDATAIARAAVVLQRGGLVAFPTETVYGLGAHALDRIAVRRIFEAKGRPANDPLIVHVSSIDELPPLVAAVPSDVHRLAERFWPGPLTVVLPRSPLVPDEVTAGLRTVAVRVPANTVAQALMKAARLPIAAPSANLFSRPSPTKADHVLQDLDGRIDMVLDAGPTLVGVESTVLDLSHDVPTVLRPGAVTLEMLHDALPHVRMREAIVPMSADEPMPSPGLLSRHYSPQAPVTLYEGEPSAVIARLDRDARDAAGAGTRVGIIAADEDQLVDVIAHVVRLGPQDDLAVVAARLYAALRELDAAGVDLILVRSFPEASGLGIAIRDRLRRAAGRLVRVEN